MALTTADRARRYRERHPDRVKASNTKWRKSAIASNSPVIQRKRVLVRDWHSRNPLRVLLNSARARSRRRGIEFRLDIDSLGEIPAVCPILGIPITATRGNGHRPGAPSLDRLDNTAGYIPGNVRIVSYRANVLRNDATAAELRRLLADAESREDRGT